MFISSHLTRRVEEALPFTFGHPMWRADSLEKTLGNIEGRRRREAIEDEMVGWHHRLNGHECEQTPGNGKGQGGLACCSPWGSKELDTTEWLNNNNNSGSRDDSVIRCLGEDDCHRIWLFRAKRREKEQYQQALQVLLSFFFFLNQESNLVPEVPQQTHT